jgi:hypothetical protein
LSLAVFSLQRSHRRLSAAGEGRGVPASDEPATHKAAGKDLCASFITSHVIAGRQDVADSGITPDETMRID